MEAPASHESLEHGDTTMRFMILVKANAESEAGTLPSAEQLAEMGKYNEELVKAGIMLAGEGLHPSSRGARVRFDGDSRSVVDGPFAETKELLAGFWLIQVKSKEEAIEWVKRIPFRDGEEVEIRPVFETEDFAPSDPTGELRAAEERLREEIAAQQS
jgi:hypothetical protein